MPLRAVRAAATAAVALAVRLVPVQRGGVRGLRFVHVLRQGPVLPLRERRGGGGRLGVLVRAAAGRGVGAGRAAALPVPVLASARRGGGGRGAVRARAAPRLPLPRAAALLQYYLVPRPPCTNIYSPECGREASA